MAAVEPPIRTEGLTKSFGRRAAVDGLDLQVAKGEIFGFLGPNGAGKTTTIRMLSGLARPTSGSAWLLGAPVPDNLARVIGQVGSLLENPSFYPTMSAKENLHALALTARNRQALERIDLQLLSDS